MQTSPADIADRYSILQLKFERLTVCHLIKPELEEYRTAAMEHRIPSALLNQLYEVNGKIWDLESDIRSGRENTLNVSDGVKAMPLEQLLRLAEVGARALAIRDLNGQRIAIKNQIATAMGGFQEVKGKHASAA